MWCITYSREMKKKKNSTLGEHIMLHYNKTYLLLIHLITNQQKDSLLLCKTNNETGNFEPKKILKLKDVGYHYHYVFVVFEHQMKNLRASLSESTFTRILPSGEGELSGFTFHPIQSYSIVLQLIRNHRQQSGKPMNMAKNKKEEVGLLHFAKQIGSGALRDMHETSR